MKKTMITGVQPTGNFTLGNYIGAIKNFIAMQKEYDSYIFIADLHGITSYQEPSEINKRILDLAAIYLACGVDPKHTKFFIQSDVVEHGILGFIMAFQCRVGELERMTQYKAKKKNKSVDLGLLIYPTLMAGDILLYDASIVPVGSDQKQHIEITRDIGERFNKRYGNTFEVPDYYIPTVGARIMNLQNPTEKMSKSASASDKGTIFILDDAETINKKIMSSVTDNENKIKFDEENKPGISNLITIYSAITNESITFIEEKFKNKNYGEFKKQLALELINFLKPIQEKYYETRNSNRLKEILKEGAEQAHIKAENKLKQVRKNLGLLI